MNLIGTLGVVFAFCWAWNELFLRFAFRLGALSQGIPHQRRWESKRKPIIGGISFFVALLGVGALHGGEATLPPALLGGAVIAFFTGLADDAYVMLPQVKFFGQLAAAMATMVLGGPQLDAGHPVLTGGLTIFWYVAVMNAFNLMDNMDGAAGSIALPLLIGGSWLLGGQEALVYMGLAAAVAAFLLRNWHPSAFYMGDNGSQLLGFILGYLGLSIVEKYPVPFWTGLVALVAMYSLLAGDTFWVIISRLLRSQSPFVGGTDHLTHLLAQKGLSPKGVALLLMLTQMGLTAMEAYLWRYESSMVQLVVSLIGISVIGAAIGIIHLQGYFAGWRYSRAKAAP
jgi:UDP-GlcNAc:undecaprenyl-phosphate/decaprenyl-phosphate GlcNAc-1-phosphate transferase